MKTKAITLISIAVMTVFTLSVNGQGNKVQADKDGLRSWFNYLNVKGAADCVDGLKSCIFTDIGSSDQSTNQNSAQSWDKMSSWMLERNITSGSDNSAIWARFQCLDTFQQCVKSKGITIMY